jgi:hypothetical protein
MMVLIKKDRLNRETLWVTERNMDELEQIKRLAGINEFKGYQLYDGSNISITGNEKGELMKKHNIKPGTPEWFQLWFSLPYLTGEKPL